MLFSPCLRALERGSLYSEDIGDIPVILLAVVRLPAGLNVAAILVMLMGTSVAISRFDFTRPVSVPDYRVDHNHRRRVDRQHRRGIRESARGASPGSCRSPQPV